MPPRYHRTAIKWEDLYQGVYRVPPGQMPCVPPVKNYKKLGPVSQLVPTAVSRLLRSSDEQRIDDENERIAAQLADAVASQASFVGRILALGPTIINDAWIDRAVARYGQFLQLARAHPNVTLVPTLDVDLIWHVHMLSPLDYQDDCHALLGRLLAHDDALPDTTLAAAFEATKSLWHSSHGVPYVWTGERAAGSKMEQRKRASSTSNSSYSGCGSCGWGDEHFHSDLHHHESEEQQVRRVLAAPSPVIPAD